MRDRDAALDEAIHEAAAILGDALLRLFFLKSAHFSVDSPEIESPHVTTRYHHENRGPNSKRDRGLAPHDRRATQTLEGLAERQGFEPWVEV